MEIKNSITLDAKERMRSLLTFNSICAKGRYAKKGKVYDRGTKSTKNG